MKQFVTLPSFASRLATGSSRLKSIRNEALNQLSIGTLRMFWLLVMCLFSATSLVE